MIYYGIAAIFPLLCWAFHDWWIKQNELSEVRKEKFKRGMVISAIIPMFLLFVFRYKYIGADTIGYVRFFQKEIRGYSWSAIFDVDAMRFEIGFRLYVKIISLFTDNYTVFFLINALIIFGILLRFSFKYTQNAFVFFFLFIALGTYGFFETGLRQALAMVICLLSIDFVKDKKLIPFLLLVLLAYYFHKSALIFMVIYPLSLIKKYDWMLFVYAVLAVVFILGFSAFQDMFNQILGYEYDIEETGNGGIFMMLVFVLLAFSLFMTYDKPKDVEGQSIILQLSLMTVVFWLLRLISRTAERISYYYIFGLYAYFSQAIKYDKDKLSSLLKWLLILACLVLFVYRNLGANYQFFWQGA
ncbi:MAG: EpsG family protein [Clostridia bacterium]|nr:EpsG family protein [Clostridia bacterium]